MRHIDSSRHPLQVILSFIVVLVLIVGWYDKPLRQAVLLTVDLVLQPSVNIISPLGSETVDTNVEIPYGDRSVGKGIMRRPTGVGNGGAVILVPGYLPTMSDPLLDRLAQDLIHMGFVVLIPETGRLRQGLVTPDDVEVLVAAFLWLSEQPGISSDAIGFIGFCIGGSLAMVAAADLRINERVSYINIFGGYFDARTAFRSIGTHTMVLDDQTITWQPAPQAVALYLQNVLIHIESDTSRRQIEQALQENRAVDVATFDTDTRQIYQVLLARTSREMDERLALLPVEKQTYFAAISPSHWISQLKTRVFVMHDWADPYMPVSESYQLVEALSGSNPVIVTRFQLFDHVRPQGLSGKVILLKESIKLIRHLSHLFDAMNP